MHGYMSTASGNIPGTHFWFKPPIVEGHKTCLFFVSGRRLFLMAGKTTRWWFQKTSLLGEIIQFDKYFFESGLKPRTPELHLHFKGFLVRETL